MQATETNRNCGKVLDKRWRRISVSTEYSSESSGRFIRALFQFSLHRGMTDVEFAIQVGSEILRSLNLDWTLGQCVHSKLAGIVREKETTHERNIGLR